MQDLLIWVFSHDNCKHQVRFPGFLNNYLNSLLKDAWLPKNNSLDQYIQVDLLEEEPLYGVIISGSVYMESYTTTFNVLYSSDGHTFSYINENNNEMKEKVSAQIENILL